MKNRVNAVSASIIIALSAQMFCFNSFGEEHSQQGQCSTLLEEPKPSIDESGRLSESRWLMDPPPYGTIKRDHAFIPYQAATPGAQAVPIKIIDGGVRIAGYTVQVLGITVKVPPIEYRPRLPFVRKLLQLSRGRHWDSTDFSQQASKVLGREFHETLWQAEDLGHRASKILGHEFRGVAFMNGIPLGNPVQSGEFRGPGGYRATFERSYDDAIKGRFVKIWNPSRYGIVKTAQMIQYDLFKESLLKEIQKTCKNKHGNSCFKLRHGLRKKALIREGVTVSKLGKGIGLMDFMGDHPQSKLPNEVVDLILALRAYNSEVFKIGVEKYNVISHIGLDPVDVYSKKALKQLIETWTHQPYEGQTMIFFGLDVFGWNNILINESPGNSEGLELIDW